MLGKAQKDWLPERWAEVSDALWHEFGLQPVLVGGRSEREEHAARVITERFPVRTRLHGGWKGMLFNTLFVGTFNAMPRSVTRRLGWHLIAICRK